MFLWTCDPFDMNNDVAAHVQKEDHQIDREGAMIVGQQEFCWKKKAMEAIRIHQCDRMSMNLDCGLSLDGIWHNLLPLWT